MIYFVKSTLLSKFYLFIISLMLIFLCVCYPSILYSMPKRSINDLYLILWFVDSSLIHSRNIFDFKGLNELMSLDVFIKPYYNTAGLANTFEVKNPIIKYYTLSDKYNSLFLKNAWVSNELNQIQHHPNLSLDIYLNQVLLNFKLHLSITHHSYVVIGDYMYKNILIWSKDDMRYYAQTADLAKLGMDIDCLRVRSINELIAITGKGVDDFPKSLINNLVTKTNNNYDSKFRTFQQTFQKSMSMSKTSYNSHLNLSLPRVVFDEFFQIDQNKSTSMSRLVYDSEPGMLNLFKGLEGTLSQRLNYAFNKNKSVLIFDINNKGNLYNIDPHGLFIKATDQNPFKT